MKTTNAYFHQFSTLPIRVPLVEDVLRQCWLLAASRPAFEGHRDDVFSRKNVIRWIKKSGKCRRCLEKGYHDHDDDDDDIKTKSVQYKPWGAQSQHGENSHFQGLWHIFVDRRSQPFNLRFYLSSTPKKSPNIPSKKQGEPENPKANR